MQALLRTSRRLENVRITLASPDNLPTLLGAVECLPSLSLVGSRLGQPLHTAAQEVIDSARDKSWNFNVNHPCTSSSFISKHQQNAPPAAIVSFNVAATILGCPAGPREEQHLMALQAYLMEQKAISMKNHRILSPSASILLPSKHCGLLQEHSDMLSNVEDNAADASVWQADSVRRKRKKKMNKHKHSKRRKLTRHKR